jgi:hypothetical protein
MRNPMLSNHSRHLPGEPSGLLPMLCAWLLAGCCMCFAASAHAQIRSPNHHPHYAVELEPHLVLQWTNDPYFGGDGIGVGFRASIPIIDNGPISSINNSLAIGFGLDWAHFGGCGPYGNSCNADDFWLPIVLQWNFFLTDWFSLFPEFGLAIQHSSLGWAGSIPGDCRGVGGRNICVANASYTDVDLVLWLGARFAISERVAFTLRLGTPSILIGASFML